MPKHPQKASKRRRGPSGPEQMAKRQAREADESLQPPRRPEPSDGDVIQPVEASESTTPKAAPDPDAVPAPAPVPTFAVSAIAARSTPPPSTFRATRSARQQVDRLSIPTVVQAQFKGDLLRIGVISVVMAGILGALTIVLG